MMENMQKIKKTLMTSIFEVFEKMFYVFLEPVDNNVWDHHSMVSIHFSGPMKGGLRACFSQGLADAMVQNMLNIDESEITDRLREDCLKESVNMICGNFLRNIDSSKVFDLSLPVRESGTNETGNAASGPSEQKLRLNFTSSSGMLGIIFGISALTRCENGSPLVRESAEGCN
jgi:CheY-specific phosphatase CheX